MRRTVFVCCAGLVLAAASGCGSSKRDFEAAHGGASGNTAASGAGAVSGSADAHNGGTAGSGGSEPRAEAGEGGMAGAAGEDAGPGGPTACPATEYFDGEQCKTLTVCTANEFEAVPAAPDRDRVCQSLAACTADQYAVPGASGKDRSCVPLSVCGAGTSVSGNPTATTDRACTPCAAGSFSSQPNTSMCKACTAGSNFSSSTGATSCTACSSCGWFPASACTVTADVVCTKQNTTKQEGTSDDNASGGLVVDGAGNVWVAGTNYTAKSHVVLYKYDPKGVKLKTISIASATGSERAYGLVLDTAGNVWVGGSTTGVLAGTNPSSVQMGFAARFAPDGTAKGVVQIANNMGMIAIAPGLAGDVWLTAGTMMTHITDSGGTLSFTAPGDFSQVSTFATGIQDAYGITVDSNGNPWVTGITDAGLYVFKGVPSGQVNSTSAKFVEFNVPRDPATQPLTLRAVGSNVWVLGKVRTRYDDSDSSVPAGGFGGRDGFIVRFTASDAQPHESTQFGGLGNDYVNSTFLDSKGDLWVSGQAEATFGGKTSLGGWDIFATRFTIPASGKAVQTTETYLVGTDQQEKEGWVALDAAQHLWVAGSTEGQFPGGLNQGASDIFVTEVGK